MRIFVVAAAVAAPTAAAPAAAAPAVVEVAAAEPAVVASAATELAAADEPAAADDATTAEPAAFMRQPPEPPPAPPQISLKLALGASLGATALGTLLVATDGDVSALDYIGGTLLLVGPSLGHWYARDPWNTGTSFRAAGCATMLLGLTTRELITFEGDADKSNETIGNYIIVLGVGVFGVGALYELATTPRAVHAYNRKQADLTISLVPTRNGLAIAGAF